MSFLAADHTFVLCAYKENPYIRETIDSLRSQTVRSNIVLSTSTPNEYLKDICEDYSLRMLINTHPHLAGDDWNYGFDHAGTRLVTIAHQDDYYAPDYVESVLKTLNKYKEGEVSIVFTDYFEMRGDERVHSNWLLRVKRLMNMPFRFDALNGHKLVKRRVLSFGCPICCPSVTLVASNVGMSPFDTRYKNSCDYKTWVDLASREGRFVYVPEALMGHRIYPGSATSHNLEEDIRKGEDEEIMATLWPRPVAHLINRAYAVSEKSNEL